MPVRPGHGANHEEASTGRGTRADLGQDPPYRRGRSVEGDDGSRDVGVVAGSQSDRCGANVVGEDDERAGGVERRRHGLGRPDRAGDSEVADVDGDAGQTRHGHLGRHPGDGLAGDPGPVQSRELGAVRWVQPRVPGVETDDVAIGPSHRGEEDRGGGPLVGDHHESGSRCKPSDHALQLRIGDDGGGRRQLGFGPQRHEIGFARPRPDQRHPHGPQRATGAANRAGRRGPASGLGDRRWALPASRQAVIALTGCCLTTWSGG